MVALGCLTFFSIFCLIQNQIAIHLKYVFYEFIRYARWAVGSKNNFKKSEYKKKFFGKNCEKKIPCLIDKASTKILKFQIFIKKTQEFLFFVVLYICMLSIMLTDHIKILECIKEKAVHRSLNLLMLRFLASPRLSRTFLIRVFIIFMPDHITLYISSHFSYKKWTPICHAHYRTKISKD